MEVTCGSCNQTREVNRNTGAVCRKCSSDKRRGSDYSDAGYKHTCMDCEAVWTTKTDSKAKRCMPCSNKANGLLVGGINKKKEEDKVSYQATCTECGDVRYLKANPIKLKTTLCGTCSRRRTGKMKLRPKYPFMTEPVSISKMNQILEEVALKKQKVRHFRVCTKCPPSEQCKQVKSATNAGTKPCNKHANKPRGKERKKVTNYKDRGRKVTAETVSDVAINKARQVNRDYKAQLASEKKKRVEPKTQEDMNHLISKWLVDNKPSTQIRNDEPFPHLSQQMYARGN